MPRNVDDEPGRNFTVLKKSPRAATRLSNIQGILLRRRLRPHGGSDRHLIPIIDIFAGPGGLGEGFASVRDTKGRSVFDLKLSIEKDEHAWQTLLLRSFFRQFDPGEVPKEYYQFLRGEWNDCDDNVEHLLARYTAHGAAAKNQAWKAELCPKMSNEVDERIKKALGPGQHRRPWILIGGPPCQAYSLVGRVRMLAERGSRFYTDKRHTLYHEYLRLIARHVPSIFIMENVKGILSSTTQNGSGIFQQIIRDLRRPADGLRYRLYALAPKLAEQPIMITEEDPNPGAFVIRSEMFGIPQARHRVIIMGILENDFNCVTPESLDISTGVASTCRQAISDLPALRSGLSRGRDSAYEWLEYIKSIRHTPWFRQLGMNGAGDIVDEMRKALNRLSIPPDRMGGRFVRCMPSPGCHKKWFGDSHLAGACNHESRHHMPEDLHRYFFISCYGKTRGISARLEDLPKNLLPAHENVQKALKTGLFNDRFRVQLYDRPATTITSHIAKDGHYFIHPDPVQCRSLTVREAARLQTFPDNYFFTGPRTDQYSQVGNAVPPMLAAKIAKVVARVFQALPAKK